LTPRPRRGAHQGGTTIWFGLGHGNDNARFKAIDVLPYIIAQLVGAIAAAAVLYGIASGKPDFVMGGFASNGYGALSPGKYSLASCLMMEAVGTFFFLSIILGSTHSRAPTGFAPIAIGLGLTLIHLISIPVTNTSVNPARSTGPALLAGGEYLAQLWLFWVAPIAGALIAGSVSRWLQADEPRFELAGVASGSQS
jgi:aquaporin Z